MYDSFGLKGTIPGHSQIWLIPDGDEPPGQQNYAGPNNNHGANGENVLFCDGYMMDGFPHKEYSHRYALSQDDRTDLTEH